MTTLREAATQALEALEDFGMKYYENTGEVLHREVYESLKSALEADDGMYGAKALTKAYENGWNAAKAEPVQEPVAWSYELATTMLEHRYDGWEHLITRYKPNVPEGSIRNLTPLFAAPHQRKPLTDEEIDALALVNSYLAFARAIERTHGIK